jgi:CheY-like chemotaxis protein
LLPSPSSPERWCGALTSVLGSSRSRACGAAPGAFRLYRREVWCAALKSDFKAGSGLCRGTVLFAKTMASPGARLLRILFVVDDHELRRSTESLLKSDGYLVDRVDPARSEDTHVKRTGSNKPDLILVSLDAPAVRVVDTAKKIRQQAGLDEQTPIVVFSISAVPEGAEEAIGENICITSPANFNQLRALFARILCGRFRTQ